MTERCCLLGTQLTPNRGLAGTKSCKSDPQAELQGQRRFCCPVRTQDAKSKVERAPQGLGSWGWGGAGVQQGTERSYLVQGAETFQLGLMVHSSLFLWLD